MMEYITINSINVPQIGLGLFNMHGEMLRQSINSAIHAGYTYFDTAYRYGNEREIGSLLSEFKKELIANPIVSTKLSQIQYWGTRRKLYLDRMSIDKALRMTTKNLQTDTIDIYFLHSPFNGFSKAYRELIHLKTKGKLKIIGVSGFDVDQMNRLKRECGVYPDVCMIEIHPFHFPHALVSFCQEKGAAIIARSPFAHGDILDELLVNDRLLVLSKKYGKTIPQVILRWIVQWGMIATPRSNNTNHIKENIDIFDFSLSDDEMKAINDMNRNCSYGVVSLANPR